MVGYIYGEAEPTEKCPYCSEICHADFADIGVGMQQVGPFQCTNCHASEIGCYDEPRDLSPREKETGWYAPDTPPGSSANVIGGHIVSHREMDHAYRAESRVILSGMFQVLWKRGEIAFGSRKTPPIWPRQIAPFPVPPVRFAWAVAQPPPSARPFAKPIISTIIPSQIQWGSGLRSDENISKP